MSDRHIIKGDEVIDDRPITFGQWRIIITCSLMSMIDGFDLQAIAFAAPSIKEQWNLSPALLGPVFSAGLFGGMIGGFLLGPLSDRTGPRRVLLCCAIVVGLSTLVTALATNTVQLIAIRAVTGVAIGAASPPIVALLSAFSPPRLRATLVTVAFCTQLLGALVGSVVSAMLMESHGWQSIFVLGGLLPLIAVVPILALYVPEPLDFLYRTGASSSRIGHALALIGRNEERAECASPEGRRPESPIGSAGELFADGRAREMIAFLLTCLTGGTFFYFLANWLPMILRQDGASIQLAVYGSTALNLGGLAGAIIFAWLIDRFSAYPVMVTGYLVGGVLIAAIAAVSPGVTPVIAMVGVAAFFGIGAQYCIPACIVTSYPPRMHGAATGFALAFGRIGAVIGPMVGSFILLAGGRSPQLYLFSSIMAVAAALCIFAAMKLTTSRPSTRRPVQDR